MRAIAVACLSATALWLVLPGSAAGSGKSWTYSPPTRPPVPVVKQHSLVRNPIDAFVSAQLEQANHLKPTSEAERPVLIRRLTFDLTGLPPTPAEIDAFVHDSAPNAYEKVVDRLLTSPRFGERWATYWLDLVRFAESDGFKADDVRPNAWRYRDYVIQAFNRDLPYDRFVREQLAGDELYPGDPDALVATALNRHFPDEHNARNLALRRQEILNDVTDTTGQVFLGLTVGCARCHDHKFDPITQVDYYRLQAFFAALSPRNDLPLFREGERQTYSEHLRRWQESTAELRKQAAALEQPVHDKLVERTKSKFALEYQQAYDTPVSQRTPLQQQLADILAKQLTVSQQEMVRTMKPEVRQQWQDLANKMAPFEKLKPALAPVTMGITDIGTTAPPTHLLQRGNLERKGIEVSPGFLSILDKTPVQLPALPEQVRTTGRRAALALWLTRPDHPLTARVMVNRLWQHHFGRGIVGTPSDLGVLGQQATHPELLDWLACEFVKRGWSLKAMHRLMVTSATYRQAARGDGAAARVDPDNRLLWRANRRRLEGEALRDAMLAVAGRLNLKAGGPSVFPELPAEMGVPRGGWPVSTDDRERDRRSVYVFVKRNLRYPLFSAFDAPDSNESCARRHVSTNAPQALMLMNGKLTLDAARFFAGRVLRETAAQPGQVVPQAYRLALGRDPDAHELDLSLQFLVRQAGLVRERLARRRPVALAEGAPVTVDPAFGGAVVELCHVLLNLNEFAYLD